MLRKIPTADTHHRVFHTKNYSIVAELVDPLCQMLDLTCIKLCKKHKNNLKGILHRYLKFREQILSDAFIYKRQKNGNRLLKETLVKSQSRCNRDKCIEQLLVSK